MHPYLFRFAHPLTGDEVLVTAYAALMFVGAAAGIALSTALAPWRRFPRFDVFGGGAIAFGVGYIGARAMFLALHGADAVEEHGWGALLTSGGLVWYGGALSGIGAFVVYLRGYRLPLRVGLDVGAPGVALGHALGRLGCVTAGCCFGRPAAAGEIAIRFPPGGFAPPGIPLVPVQLYEAGGLLLLCAALVALLRVRRLPAGSVAALYLAGYALLRIYTETLRFDDRGGWLGPLSPSQAVAIAVIVGVVAIIGWRWWRASLPPS